MKKKTILIADDEPDIREFISYNLNKHGFKVLQADNGLIACDIALTYHPDLILLDIMMPEMNGFEACRKLREDKSMDNTVIIFLSAMSEAMANSAGYNFFIDGFIAKPIPIYDLINRIKGYFEEE